MPTPTPTPNLIPTTAQATPAPAVIAHVSDIHIVARDEDDGRSIARTRAVMEYLNDLPYDLDAIIVTGDIADHGTPAEYEEARKLLVSRHPLLTCPGNHDERGAFREHLLGEAPTTSPINQSYSTDRFTLALCDTSVPGKHHGTLTDETLTWLSDTLAAAPPTRPALIAFHHPPVDLHTPYVDEIRQFDESRLAELTTRHPNITAFLAGHAHTPAATTFADRPLLVAPGVTSTLRLPWEHQTHPTHHIHQDLPPALAFHVLNPAGRLTTHYRPIPLP
ncbi:metallophosphoesterase [Streptomyces sp. WAC 01529]|uniref:metallophosphoesterase n=1 Tax=Streptomyces sp. WAC 01529 TaxID=2203205 RepID=UPI000F6BA451|nr:metallophosphoesterase [Streptomyces sp. WAC 01529]AZM52867.1 metallophosphoesterase [Streptomyces sp. WAC 01529]